jgi:hypothetical protein
MKRIIRILIAAAVICSALPASAYNDFYTHPDLTILATRKSVLYTDGTIMRSLGLLPAVQQGFLYGARFEHYRIGTMEYDLAQFIGEGSYDEDLGVRPRNHFYDPYNEKALSFLGPANYKSPDWMLEPSTILEQSWSLRDTREYLRRALTFTEGSPVEADEQRRRAMASVFLGLGHVLHHIQDMAQPQHTRDDTHIDSVWAIPFGLYNPSRYEDYTMRRRAQVNGIAAGASPLDLSTGQFRVARDFWKNISGTGMAERTNREFVSHGTNFVEGGSHVTRGGYPLPLAGIGTEYTVQALYDEAGAVVPAQIQSLCGLPATGCTMVMVATNTTPKASTFSIFDQDMRRNGITVVWEGIVPVLTRVLYSLNRFNFDDHHRVLIDRAVSYSAGFLNHFFRGKFEVMRPETGAWAVVDHASESGFREIRARVKNVSTNDEALNGGTLRAIARFHRNNCYQSDLSGEWQLDSGGNLMQPCPDYRSPEEHLRMTATQQATFAPGETKNMTFTFSDPIPYDVTDLILQVYYEGQVGIEAEAFAIGAADLSETTYFSILNGTDMFDVNGQGFYYPDEIKSGIARGEFPFSLLDRDGNKEYTVPPDVDINGGDIAYEIYLDGKKFGDVTLPQGSYARFAALVSPFGAELTLIARGNGFNDIDSYQFPGKVLQYDPDLNSFVVSVVSKLRKQALHFASVTYYHYYPVSGAELETMRESKAGEAMTPVPVTPVPPTP